MSGIHVTNWKYITIEWNVMKADVPVDLRIFWFTLKSSKGFRPPGLELQEETELPLWGSILIWTHLRFLVSAFQRNTGTMLTRSR